MHTRTVNQVGVLKIIAVVLMPWKVWIGAYGSKSELMHTCKEDKNGTKGFKWVHEDLEALFA